MNEHIHEWWPTQFDGYWACECGQLRGKSGKTLKQTKVGRYWRVTLSRPDVRANYTKQEFVHKMVCYAIYGEPPEGKEMALHWDDDPDNNRADNLRWGNAKENCRDRDRNGRTSRGAKHRKACGWGTA